MHQQKFTRLVVATLLCWSAGESVRAQPSQFFDGKNFDLKKLADSDAISSELIPRSSKVWMKLETVYKDAKPTDTGSDKRLLAQIKTDQDAKKQVQIDNVWKLFSRRMSEHRYSEADSCLNLAGALLADSPDSSAYKTLQTNIERLGLATGDKRHDKVRSGYVAVTNATTETRSGLIPGIGNAFAFSRPRARGYTGLRLIDGKVDVAIRYSPAAKSELFQPGDEIVSINGVPSNNMTTQASWLLSSGTQGELLHFIYSRAGKQKTANLTSQAYPSLQNIDQLTAREKFELASQMREIGNMEGARSAFKKAAAEDPNGDAGKLAIKALRSRMGRFEAPGRCIDIYSRAYFGNFDHEEVKAEALFRYCISEWPQYELPYKQLAGLMMKDNRLREAESVLNQLFVVNPDYARGWTLMAMVKSQLGDKKGSEACSKKAHDLDPEDAPL